ncbi:MAG TPA: hypothetical protein VMD59_18855 [Acidimicrobiales bacterium]|nr:hypothetical protein [Acidimicrobiales bacterium]
MHAITPEADACRPRLYASELGRRDPAAATLLEILAASPLQPPPDGELGWLRHPAAAALYRWAAELVGCEGALRAASHVAARAELLAEGVLDPTAFVAGLRRDARHFRAERSRAAREREHLTAWPRELADEPAAVMPPAPDPLEVFPGWLARATGWVLAPATRELLLVCATIAVDLAAEDDRIQLSIPCPIGGVLRRRLAEHLDPPLDSPVARRSTARLLLGPTGRPSDGALSRFARREHPLDVPTPVRSSWAADLLDLEPERFAGRRRPVAREAARRSVLRQSFSLSPGRAPATPVVATAGRRESSSTS